MKRAIALVCLAFCIGSLGNALAHRFPDSYNMVVNQIVPGACGFNSSPCIVQSLETVPVGYGSLPSCTSSLRGTIKMTTDAGYRYCDTTWLALTGSGSSGGIGPYSPLDAGYTLVGEQGMTGPKIIYADAGSTVYALYLSKGQDMSGGTQGIGICFAGNAVTPNGANCSDATSRDNYLFLSSDVRLHMKDYLVNDNTGYIEWRGYIASINSYVQANSYLRTIGTSTGSLPSCAAGTAGALEYDTSETRMKYCNGSSWLPVLSSYYRVWSSACPSGDSCQNVETDWIGSMESTSADSSSVGSRITCSWGTAGSSGGSAVVQIRDPSGGVLCECTLTTCNAAAHTAYSCTCSGALVSGRKYNLRWSAPDDGGTSCGVNVPVESLCNVETLYTTSP